MCCEGGGWNLRCVFCVGCVFGGVCVDVFCDVGWIVVCDVYDVFGGVMIG